jgi:cytoskeleton-associated protein 5
LRALRTEWEAEREAHKHQKHEESVEKLRLIQEINELQKKNSQLGDEHTRDILAIKSRDTQLTRVRSDLEVAHERITKLESDIEKMSKKNNFRSPSKLALSSTLSAAPTATSLVLTSPSSLRPNKDILHESPDKPMDRPRRESMMGPIGANRLKTGSYSSNGESSNMMNGSSVGARASAMPIAGMSGVSVHRRNTGARGASGSDSNWKRAAEVTLQLKARIENMRQRQEQNRGASYARKLE